MEAVTGKPYRESRNGNVIVREFSVNIPIGDLVWHCDEYSRKIKVLEGDGWQFQFDNELPQTLVPGQVILVPRETYHRVLIGYTNLILEITESI